MRAVSLRRRRALIRPPVSPTGAYHLTMFDESQGYFAVTYLHRSDLAALGFDASRVRDKTMRRIASKLEDGYVAKLYWSDLAKIARQMRIPKKRSRA